MTLEKMIVNKMTVYVRPVNKMTKNKCWWNDFRKMIVNKMTVYVMLVDKMTQNKCRWNDFRKNDCKQNDCIRKANRQMTKAWLLIEWL